MSTPLLVKISRDGTEIGTYEAQEAVRLLVSGVLKETDFYWHEGMTEWEPLLKLRASEARRVLAERSLQAKQEEIRRAAQLAQDEEKKAEQLADQKAKAKEEEDREVAEAVRVRLEAKRDNYFKCHCCHKPFVEPIDGTGLGSVAVQVIGVLFVITAFVAGGTNAHLLGILGIAMYWGPEIRSRLASLCPHCRSTNFSRPEKKD
jgi:hypothetical protein